MDSFLKVSKDYFGIGLKSIDLLIVSQIEELEKNKEECFISNGRFANMFGESESTIKRSLDKLEEMKIIKRSTSYVKGNGRANKRRILTVNKRNKWKVHNDPANTMEGSNIDNGRFKNKEWKVHNDPIKDNLSIEERAEKNKRMLEDLSNTELDGIMESYRAKVKYNDICKKYNLPYNSLNKNVIDNIPAIKNKRAKEHESEKVSSILGLGHPECEELSKYFGTTNTEDGVVVCVDLIKEYMDNSLSCDINDLVCLLRQKDYDLDRCNADWSAVAKDWQELIDNKQCKLDNLY